MGLLHLRSSHWIIETESKEEFTAAMASNDLPIDSNVMIFSGNLVQSLDIWDVYRPKPTADIRYTSGEIIRASSVQILAEFQSGPSGLLSSDSSLWQWTSGC